MLESKTDSYQKSVDERISAGIEFVKACFLIKKYPGTIVAVMGQSDKTGKSDTVRIIQVTKEVKEEAKPQDE